MKIISQRTLVKDDCYNSFPSIARMADGRLIMVFRRTDNRLRKHGAVTHVDPSAKVASITSADNGASWSDIRVIYNDEMSEQDPCVTCIGAGEIEVD